MFLAYRIDSARRVVVLSAARRPSVDEWFAMLEAATSDPEYRPGFDLIYDRARDDPPLDKAGVREWAERYATAAAARGARLAVVVSTPAAYGVSRMGAVFAGLRGATVDVFWSVSDALIWLGRGPHRPPHA